MSNPKSCTLPVIATLILAVFSILPPENLAAQTAGRWVSTEHVTFTGTAKVGSKFFLDIVVSQDGSFSGTWEDYVCLSYPGAYGINILSCQRSKKSRAASGRFDASSQTGQVDLKELGKSSFRFKTTSSPKGQPQLDIDLPPDWLKQGDPVLYQTSLNLRPPGKRK